MTRATSEDLRRAGIAKQDGVYRKIASDESKVKRVVKTTSEQKNFLEFALISAKVEYVKEFQFCERRWKFDYAIPSLKIAVEFEGLVFDNNRATSTGQSGHTNNFSFSKNCTKYNKAAILGWVVLRYSVLNYSEIVNDLKFLLESKK